MALRRVDLSTDVYFVCLNHAMCTEGEEIVGLLVGEVDEERVAHVSAVLILRRSDKRKDRVEISPEQLSNASTEAEKLACILKRPVRVVGWYHSHPKLTVYPSLVDVCTQESYQLMDEGFIGMIFSVFNTDPNKFGGRIQMICYQSQTVIIDCNVEKSHVEIPIQLVPSSYINDVCMNSVVQLPRFLCQEEQLAYQMANQVPLDYLTRLHNSSVYLRKMGQIAEVICGPLLKMLEERILNNEMKRKILQERKKGLTAMIEKARKERSRKEQEMLEKAELQQEMREMDQEMSEIEAQEMLIERQPEDHKTYGEEIEIQEVPQLEQQKSHIEDPKIHESQPKQLEKFAKTQFIKREVSEKAQIEARNVRDIPQFKDKPVQKINMHRVKDVQGQCTQLELEEQLHQETQVKKQVVAKANEPKKEEAKEKSLQEIAELKEQKTLVQSRVSVSGILGTSNVPSPDKSLTTCASEMVTSIENKVDVLKDSKIPNDKCNTNKNEVVTHGLKLKEEKSEQSISSSSSNNQLAAPIKAHNTSFVEPSSSDKFL